MVTATREQQSTRYGKRWARPALLVKKVGGMPPEALGPWRYTLLDGQAALALESMEITDMCMNGGKELPRTRSKIPRQGGSRLWERP